MRTRPDCPRRERRCLTAAALALTVWLADAGDVRSATTKAGSPEHTLQLRCAPSYLAGLPLVVAVELRNLGEALDEIPFFDLVYWKSSVVF
jgi:hypothetical protein